MAREYIVYSAHINKKKRPEAGPEGGRNANPQANADLFNDKTTIM